MTDDLTTQAAVTLAENFGPGGVVCGLVLAAAVGVGGVVANQYGRKEATAKIVLNGQTIYDGTAAFSNDRVMFPIGAAQKGGVRVYYDTANKIAVLRCGGSDNQAMQAGSGTMLTFMSAGDRWLREGEEGLGTPFEPLRAEMETPPLVEKGQFCVPLRVIAAALGAHPFADVQWDAETRTGTITTRAVLYGAAGEPESFAAPEFLTEAFGAAPGS